MTDSGKKWNVYVWIMTGFILSSMLAFLWHGNGRINQKNFWSDGVIYDFSSDELRNGTDTCQYVGDGFQVSGDPGQIWFDVESNVKKWKQIAFQLDEIGPENLYWRISFFNEQGTVVRAVETVVTEGWNYINVNVNSKVSFFMIEISGQQGATFSIHAARLCQKKALFGIKRFLWKIVWIFCGYLVISGILYLFKNYDWYLAIKMTQRFYIPVGDGAGSYLYQRFSGRTRRIVRTGLFEILFLLMIPLNISYNNRNIVMIRYCILGMMLGLIIIACLSWEKPLEKKDWRNPMAAGWLAFCTFLIVSDILVKKDIPYAGFFLWIIFGFVFFLWQNTEKYDFFLKDMVQGLTGIFPIIVSYCLIFRENTPGILYNGCFSDSESMALYMTGVWIAFLVKWNEELREGICHITKILANGVGLSLSLYYIYCARSFLCLLTCFFVFLLFVWKQRKSWIVIKDSMALIVVSLIMSAVVVGSVHYLDRFLPSKLGTDIVYTNERYEIMQEAVPGNENGIGIRSLLERQEAVRKDRQAVWGNYIRHLNLKGHDTTLTIFRRWMDASNGVLQIAYSYGVFTIIPYLMLIAGGVSAVWKRKNFLSLSVVFSFVVLSMFMNLERMFLQPIWFLFYFELGKNINKAQQCQGEKT